MRLPPRRPRPPRASAAPDAPDLAPRPAGRLSRLLSQRADSAGPSPPPRLPLGGGTGEGGAATGDARGALAPTAPTAPAPPPPDARAEVLALVALLPPPVAAALAARPDLDAVLEVVMDVGRPPLARLPDGDVALAPAPVTPADLDAAIARLGDFGADNRAGVDRTLHRVSAMRNRAGRVVGLTARVGRAVRGSAAPVAADAAAGASLLLLGRPGVGKTTAIRELSRLLADDADRRVVIVDTSNEIGGDGDVPHPAVGGARRLMVADVDAQHRVMVEAVENHMPEVVVIDEIGTECEAAAARTIAQRGVQLVATAHGGCLDNLVKNPALADLVGGVVAVTLGDDEARRRGGRKSVRERGAPPTFDVAVEMVDTAVWRVHPDLAAAVDALLAGRDPGGELRVRTRAGGVVVFPPDTPLEDALALAAADAAGEEGEGEAWVGGLPPLPPRAAAAPPPPPPATLPGPDLQLRGGGAGPIAPGDAPPLRVYAYGLPDADVAAAARGAGLGGAVVLAPRLDAADVVVALRARARASPRLRDDARAAGVPVYAVKAGGADALSRALRALVGVDPSAGGGVGAWRRDEDGAADDAPAPPVVDAAPTLAPAPPDPDAFFVTHADAVADAAAAVDAVAAGGAVDLPPRSSRGAREAQAAVAAAAGLRAEEVGSGGMVRVRILPAESE